MLRLSLYILGYRFYVECSCLIITLPNIFTFLCKNYCNYTLITTIIDNSYFFLYNLGLFIIGLVKSSLSRWFPIYFGGGASERGYPIAGGVPPQECSPGLTTMRHPCPCRAWACDLGVEPMHPPVRSAAETERCGVGS